MMSWSHTAAKAKTVSKLTLLLFTRLEQDDCKGSWEYLPNPTHSEIECTYPKIPSYFYTLEPESRLSPYAYEDPDDYRFCH